MSGSFAKSPASYADYSGATCAVAQAKDPTKPYYCNGDLNMPGLRHQYVKCPDCDCMPEVASGTESMAPKCSHVDCHASCAQKKFEGWESVCVVHLVKTPDGW